MAAILNDHVAVTFAAGNEKAFKIIFDAFHQPIHYFISRFVSCEEAEDQTAAIFAELWNNRAYFASIEAIRDFLYVSAKNACLQKLHADELEQHNCLPLMHQRPHDEDFPGLQEIESELLRRLADKPAQPGLQHGQD